MDKYKVEAKEGFSKKSHKWTNGTVYGVKEFTGSINIESDDGDITVPKADKDKYFTHFKKIGGVVNE